MSLPIKHTLVHHAALTVTDMERSVAFYAQIGFAKVAEFGPKTLVSNGTVILGLGSSTIAGDRFDENRVGLDHLSFAVESRADLETAVAYFNEYNIPHGGITDLAAFGISILAFHDPDNIALEFTAPFTG